MADFKLTSYNVHCSVDGWGRPTGIREFCRKMDADVLVLQESWTDDDGTSLAESIAEDLGYTCFEMALAHGRLSPPRQGLSKLAARRWGPVPVIGSVSALVLDESSHAKKLAKQQAAGSSGGLVERHRDDRVGHWGIAVMTRLPVVSSWNIELGKLSRDAAKRGVIAVEIELEGSTVVIFGTHMSHLSYGSPAHFRKLSKLLSSPPEAAVLVGDMNLWGPPVGLFFGNWQRVLRQRTWPSNIPLAQLDHILVTGGAEVKEVRVEVDGGSDHLPVSALIELPERRLSPNPQRNLLGEGQDQKGSPAN